MQKRYSGAPRGAGAAFAWSGNDEVGVGSMRITDSQAPERMDEMLGKDFEAGLASLRALAEAEAAKSAARAEH